jgi:hypothetical protein
MLTDCGVSRRDNGNRVEALLESPVYDPVPSVVPSVATPCTVTGANVTGEPAPNDKKQRPAPGKRPAQYRPALPLGS